MYRSGDTIFHVYYRLRGSAERRMTTTGWYDSLADAKKAALAKLSKPKTEFVQVFSVNRDRADRCEWSKEKHSIPL